MPHIRKNSLKGSLTVEASIVIPIVVICILPFIYLFRMLLFQVVLEKGLDECMKEMAAEVYVLERIVRLPEYEEEESEVAVEEGKLQQVQQLIDEYTKLFEEDGWQTKLEELGFEIVGELLLEQRLKDWLASENLTTWGVQGGWDGVSVMKSEFFYSEEGHHYLIKGAVSYEWQNLFSFWPMKPVTIQRVYHSFVGEDGQSSEEENKGEDSVIVYRIGEGRCYHKASCYLIRKNVFATTKENAEKAGSSPCERCQPQGETTVYKTKGGTHYHTNDCSYLYPQVSAFTLKEALEKGYSGCGICQGESDYFS